MQTHNTIDENGFESRVDRHPTHTKVSFSNYFFLSFFFVTAATLAINKLFNSSEFGPISRLSFLFGIERPKITPKKHTHTHNPLHANMQCHFEICTRHLTDGWKVRRAFTQTTDQSMKKNKLVCTTSNDDQSSYDNNLVRSFSVSEWHDWRHFYPYAQHH